MSRHLIFSLLVAGALTAGLVLGVGAGGSALNVSPVAGVSGTASGADTSHTPKAKSGQKPEPAESPEPADQDSGAPKGGGGSGAHPCNHGFYVSQAAHAHKGGAYVSSIARTDLGQNGDCSAPLPAP